MWITKKIKKNLGLAGGFLNIKEKRVISMQNKDQRSDVKKKKCISQNEKNKIE